MVVTLLAALLAVGSVDGLAPLSAGTAQAGQSLDLVLRPVAGACRLLLSDAQTDAPVLGAHVVVRGFGPVGAPASAAVASPGTYDGHYLVDCPPAGDGVIVEVTQTPSPELFALTAPSVPKVAAAVIPQARHLPALALLAAIGILLLLGRRAWQALMVVGLLLTTADAAAHGVDEVAAPVAPGTEIHVAQEIQFALDLRTATVGVGTFVPAGGSPAGASRQYPAVASTAVVERGGKKLVFVRLQPELFVGREVTLGWKNGEQVAVISGLNPGELAVVSGGAFLRNGGATGP